MKNNFINNNIMNTTKTIILKSNQKETKETKKVVPKVVPMEYTNDNIKEMLNGYTSVKIENLELYKHVRYYDSKFRAGGMLLNVNFNDETILLKNGNFSWKVKFENIRKIWIKKITEKEKTPEFIEKKNEVEKIKDKLYKLYIDKKLIVKK